MIHGDTNILALDTGIGEPFYGTISGLFKAYPQYQTINENGAVMHHPHLKITDWTGWTDIEEIQFVNEYKESNWIKVIIDDNRSIAVAGDELLVTYDSENPYHGFHGEVKYKYQLSSVLNIPTQKLRVRDDNIIYSFYSYRQEFTTDICTHAYRIKTKSGFYNGNNIHMNGNLFPIKFNGYK